MVRDLRSCKNLHEAQSCPALFTMSLSVTYRGLQVVFLNKEGQLLSAARKCVVIASSFCRPLASHGLLGKNNGSDKYALNEEWLREQRPSKIREVAVKRKAPLLCVTRIP
jgi:hypothetical protein